MDGKYYSADEVCRMMDHAKLTGTRFVKIAGFEATWDTGTSRPPLVAVPNAPAAPKNTDAQALAGEFEITFGEFKGMRIRDVDPKRLKTYCGHFVDNLPLEAISPALRTLIDNAEMYQFGKISWRPLEKRN